MITQRIRPQRDPQGVQNHKEFLNPCITRMRGVQSLKKCLTFRSTKLDVQGIPKPQVAPEFLKYKATRSLKPQEVPEPL